MSRGLKNCNPGNIRIPGTKYMGEVQPSKDKAFKQFESMAWGYRAMFVLLHTYQKRYGDATIRQMINRYAPPCENDTDVYVDAVSQWSGIDADVGITTTKQGVMLPIVSAMSRMENGVPAATPDVNIGWQLFVEHRP